jgi:hypothetical protein
MKASACCPLASPRLLSALLLLSCSQGARAQPPPSYWTQSPPPGYANLSTLCPSILSSPAWGWWQYLSPLNTTLLGYASSAEINTQVFPSLTAGQPNVIDYRQLPLSDLQALQGVVGTYSASQNTYQWCATALTCLPEN